MGDVIYLSKRGILMNKEISICDVANTFLSFSSMTHKKLQKLCYYAQALHLAINKEPLVKNAKFEAWVHGPVCPVLYQAYKGYGGILIPQQMNLKNVSENSYEYEFIKSIYSRYGHLTGNELELLTHTEDPWIKARKGLYDWEIGTKSIEEEDMINYYSKEISIE